jgi:hypothetical protein
MDHCVPTFGDEQPGGYSERYVKTLICREARGLRLLRSSSGFGEESAFVNLPDLPAVDGMTLRSASVVRS